MITKFLNEETIRLKLHAKNRDEAIELAAEPLIELGRITPEYVTEIKDALIELGPYIVIIPGIALAHAKPGEYVQEECMSFATFTEPVVFGHSINDPVRAVFVLASPYKDKHLDSLHSVSKLLNKPEFQKLLFESGDLREMLDYIKQEDS